MCENEMEIQYNNGHKGDYGCRIHEPEKNSESSSFMRLSNAAVGEKKCVVAEAMWKGRQLGD
jgi:hypothetical protein